MFKLKKLIKKLLIYKNIDINKIIKVLSMANNSIPWIEKYRPKKLNEVTQNDSLLDLFKNIIITGNVPHMLFYGPPGTGKTSSILYAPPVDP